MRLNNIEVHDFQMITNVSIAVESPVLLIAGQNEQGKSSMQEAIKYAMLGEMTRVSRQKDLGALVRDGATRGSISIDWDEGSGVVTLPKGTYKRSGEPMPGLPFLLNPSLFATSPEDVRRSFIFGASGVKITSVDLAAKLVAMGLSKDKVSAIAPILRGGCAAGHDEAKRRASESRGAWKATTGEAYGAVKAATWVAQKPDFHGEQLAADKLTLGQEIDPDINKLSQQISELRGRHAAAADAEAKKARLRETAAKYARIASKLAIDEAELRSFETRQAEICAAAAKRLPDEPTYSCPACGVVVRHDHDSGKLVEFSSPPPVDAADRERFDECTRAIDLLRRSVENDKRDLKVADDAAKLLASLDDISAQDVDPAKIQEMTTRLDDLRRVKGQVAERIRAGEEKKMFAEQADKKTAIAAGYHVDVTEWEAIATAMSPSGIPAELSKEATDPINQRLAASATATGWGKVTIDNDMEIRIAGRLYSLCSESARYRADLVLAEAFGQLTGAKFFAADRLDILEASTHRLTALKWLHKLAVDGELDQAIVSGTFKARPSVPRTFQVVWLENGEVVEGLEQAA